MNCKHEVVILNSELVKHIQKELLIRGADTNGEIWDWATCLNCEKQIRVIRDV